MKKRSTTSGRSNQRTEQFTASEELQFITENARRLGVVEGKLDVVLQRIDSLAQSYGVINHNSTALASRLDKVEQKLDDAAHMERKFYTALGVVASLTVAVVALLQYLHVVI